MFESAKGRAAFLVAIAIIVAGWASETMAQADSNRDTTEPLIDPNMAVVTAARDQDEPTVQVTSIDGVKQNLPHTFFFHFLTPSKEEYSYSVPAGLHVFDVQYFENRTTYINRVKILALRGHHYKFFYDGHSLRFQDMTGNALREIPLHQTIETGLGPLGGNTTVIINVINTPRATVPPLSAFAPKGNALMPMTTPGAPAQSYSQWEKSNTPNDRNESAQ